MSAELQDEIDAAVSDVEADAEPDDDGTCSVCGGSGGGDPPMHCTACSGTGMENGRSQAPQRSDDIPDHYFYSR